MGEGRREEGEVGGWLASSNDKRDILGEKAKKQTNERERERCAARFLSLRQQIVQEADGGPIGGFPLLDIKVV